MASEDERTIYCGNLSERVTEELLYELFLQVSPVEKVRIPKDQQGRNSSYGFITLKSANSIQYTILLLDGTTLFDRKITLKPRINNRDREPPIKLGHNNHHMRFDADSLLAMANNLAFTNIASNTDYYNGGRIHTYSGNNRRERGYQNREDRRSEHMPYNRYDNRNRDHRQHRRNENGNYNNWRY